MNQLFSSHLFRISTSLTGQCLVAVLFIASLRGNTHTLPTCAGTIFNVDCVLWRPQVTALANESAIVSEKRTTTLKILKMRDGLQVTRVDAVPHSAFVIQLKPICNRPNGPFVSDNVRLPSSVAVISGPIALFAAWSSPEPAVSGNVNLLPKQTFMISRGTTTRLRECEFRRKAMPIQPSGEGQVGYGASRIARPIRQALGFSKRSYQTRGIHGLSSFYQAEAA